ncbi:autotransporter outer membrane beta-barrel domain-containing protein [Chlorobium limicola]|uniref:autotransporter outer membrane beta-barrel domain-containing protein n=1 Tax=Chlorobium limicola TaxID=1092 RepID=UPI00030D685E|nr:autotransporter outer membrane beta-barrel domain-containing protein [Chlorobium limicola]
MSPRTFFINGTLNNNGSLSNNAGLGGKISIGSTGALNNAGTVINNYELTNSGTFNNAGTVINNFSLTNSGTFTNNGGLDNKGLLTNNNTFTNNGTLTNTGSFNADVISAFFNGTDITINPENLFDIIVDGIGSVISGEGLGIIYNTDDFTNNGTLNNKFVLLNAGTLTNTSPTTLNNEGLLINTKDLINSGQFNNSAIVINSSNLTNTGVLDNTGSGTFDLTSFFDGENFSFDFSNLSSLLAGNGVLLNLNGGTIDNSGTLNNDGFLINLGTLNNTSATTLNNSGILYNGNTLTNTGTLNNTGTGTIDFTPLFSEGSFSLDFSDLSDLLGGNGILVNGGTIDNSGTLNNDGFLINLGTLNNTSATTLNNNFLLVNLESLSNTQGAVANNNGIMVNLGTFTNEGQFSNGRPVSVLISELTSLDSENLLGDIASTLTSGIMVNLEDVKNSGTFDNNFVFANIGSFENQSGGVLNNDFLLVNTEAMWNKTGGNMTNNGLLMNFGTLTNDGTVSNNGTIGAFSLDNPLQLGAIYNRGTLNNTGDFTNRFIVYNDGELNTSGTFDNRFLLVNADDMENSGSMTNSGLFLNFGSFTNDGSLVNEGPFGASFSGSAFALDANTLDNPLQLGAIYNGATLNNTGDFTNRFIVYNDGELNTSGTFDNRFLLVNANNMENSGSMTNSGLFLNFGSFTNDGSLVNEGPFGASFSGSAFALDANTLDNPLQLGAIYNGATLNNTGDFTNRFIVYNDGELNTSGTFDNRFLLVNANNMENSGSMTNSGLFLNFGSFTNDGSLVNEGPFGASLPENASEMTASDLDNPIQLGAIYNGGNLTNSGTFENEFLLVNAGTLSNNTEGSMTNSGFILNFGTLANNGDLFNDGGFKNLGILKGNGTIYGYFSNDGIIAPGNSIGTLTFEGSYTHNDSAIYALEVDSIGNSDLIDVKKTVAGRSGNAILNGGLVNVSPAKGFYRWGTFYTILTAENEVFGTFDDVNFPLSSLFLVPSLRYDDRNVYLDLVSDFTSSARTDNQYAVASALDSIPVSVQGDMADVMTCLVYQPTVNSALKAIDRISGHIYTALPDASFYSIDRYLGAVSSHFGGFSMNDKQGIESGFWSSGFGGWGDRDGTDTSSQYTYELTGGIFGYDHKLSETLLLGVAAGYASTDLSMDNLNEKANVDSWQGSLYGLYKDGPLHIGLIGSYGSHNYTTTRHIDFSCVNRTASADYDAYDLSASLEAGYRIDTGKNTFIMPTASLQAIWLNSEAFAEKGASALNLIVDDEHSTTLPGRIGLTFGVETTDRKGGKFTPEVRFALRHDFAADNQYSHQASFAGAPDQSFTIKSDRVERDSFEAGATLAYETKSGTSIFVSYDANLASDMNEQAAAFGFRYTW